MDWIIILIMVVNNEKIEIVFGSWGFYKTTTQVSRVDNPIYIKRFNKKTDFVRYYLMRKLIKIITNDCKILVLS